MSNELEVVHNKKNCYKTIDGKEAQSLYKSHYYKDENQIFFKPANDLLAITSLLRLLHSFTTLLLKEYFAMSSLTLFFCNIDDLLNWILIEQKYILTNVIVTF